MPEEKKPSEFRTDFSSAIHNREKRKIRAREKSKSIWLGLGYFGIIGWAISLPTILGTLLGVWLDKETHAQRSYTLIFLVAGLTVGCLNAWFWISRESEQIKKNEEQKDE